MGTGPLHASPPARERPGLGGGALLTLQPTHPPNQPTSPRTHPRRKALKDSRLWGCHPAPAQANRTGETERRKEEKEEEENQETLHFTTKSSQDRNLDQPHVSPSKHWPRHFQGLVMVSPMGVLTVDLALVGASGPGLLGEHYRGIEPRSFCTARF